MKRWSFGDLDVVLALNAAGKTHAQIARQLGRTPLAVYTQLRKRQIAISWGCTPRPLPAPQSLLDVFLRKPTGTPLTLNHRAAPPTPPARIDQPTRGGGKRSGRNRRWTAVQLAQLAQQVADGATNAELAAQHGMNAQALANTLFRYEIRRSWRKSRSDRDRPRP